MSPAVRCDDHHPRQPFAFKAGARDYRVKVCDAQGNWREHGGVFPTRKMAIEYLRWLAEGTSTSNALR